VASDTAIVNPIAQSAWMQYAQTGGLWPVDFGYVSQSLNDVRLGELKGPTRVAAGWLSAVKRRIASSVMPPGREAENQGQWLPEETVQAALLFFETVSDMLPGEPYIYSSKTKDLVAEFKTAQGRLTAIISPDFVRTFALTYGNAAVEKRLQLGVTSNESLRQHVRRLTDNVVVGQLGGDVDP
jgi:hypothetical protein